MLPIIQVGPIALPVPLLVLLASFWIGMRLIDNSALRAGFSRSTISDLVFIGLVSGLVGARIAYGLRFLDIFLQDPLSLLAPRAVMLDASGGILTGAIASAAYIQKKSLSFWPVLDVLAPGLAFFMLGLGLSHLASGQEIGVPTSLPWGIFSFGEKRHPVQVYELLMTGVIFAFTLQRFQTKSIPGVRFLTFVACSAAGRILLEEVQAGGQLVFGSLRSVQLVAWLVLATSLWLSGRLLFPGVLPEKE